MVCANQRVCSELVARPTLDTRALVLPSSCSSSTSCPCSCPSLPRTPAPTPRLLPLLTGAGCSPHPCPFMPACAPPCRRMLLASTAILLASSRLLARVLMPLCSTLRSRQKLQTAPARRRRAPGRSADGGGGRRSYRSARRTPDEGEAGGARGPSRRARPAAHRDKEEPQGQGAERANRLAHQSSKRYRRLCGAGRARHAVARSSCSADSRASAASILELPRRDRSCGCSGRWADGYGHRYRFGAGRRS